MADGHEADVAAVFGTRLQLRFADGKESPGRLKGRRLKPVCGDRVVAEPLPGEEDWLVTEVLARRNELTRPNVRGESEVLAANLDCLAAVTAPTPKPDWFIVDRYLCAAELMRIDAAVVYNKADDGTVDAATQDELDAYREVGYPGIVCSAKKRLNLDALGTFIGDRTAIIVGQSGVGKSTMINVLTKSEQRTAAVSGGTGEGRHTTVSAALLALPTGGFVVDSPGVRDYAPSITVAADVEFAFREVHRLATDCRFNNCRHRQEPHCAVKAAVADGSISERRYESYRRLLLLAEQQDRDRY